MSKDPNLVNLSVTEYAKIHNVSRQTVYDWIGRGLQHTTKVIQVIEIPATATPPAKRTPGRKKRS
jgi:hypothetical protein